MCDCFHLAFPNWHASATGGGHRLKAPEQDTEDDLVCEEPEVLEGERPRPQGSSPVEEFPTTEKYVKQGEVDFYDSPTKSSKKGKKIGFGSLFDKRSSAKMNQTEDMQNDGSEMIVKSVKGGCAEGLVVSGGGKNGIFIKEVKPESPASKHLSVKEGDQILSATVYFDNVSYEDALQILEHAQPYRVEFCLKRKPVPTRTQEDAETMRPDVAIGEEAIGDEGTGPEMRGRRKTKKQHDRISWPKFPSLTKGRRAKFKRSHSTSEAEEQRKLEISPTTSDTESPLKSPLKSPDEKDKKSMNKMKLKKMMTGRRSKSVEETSENEQELKTDDIEVLENHNIMNIAEEHSFQESVTNLVEIPNTLDEGDKTIKTRNEFTFTTLPVTESLLKAELITLNNTLKTTDITVALGEERRERSEIKISIQGKDKSETGTESQLKSFSSGIRTSDPSIMNNIMTSPNIILQEEAVGHQVDSDIKLINQEIFEKTQGPEETDMKIPNIEVSNDVSDIELTKRSPRIGSDKVKKEINILDTESYGIRTRGPLADMAISSHFVNKPNRLEFTSSDPFTFEIKTGQEMSSTIIDPKKPSTPTPVISQPKPHVQDIKISNLETDTAELTQKANIDAIICDLGKISEAKFKLPKVDLSEFNHQESITISLRDPTKAPALKRDDIEIPGREKKRSKSGFKPPKIKEPKIEKVIKISKTGQAQGEPEEFNVDDVKKAVSKFPAFKLPERDITGVLVQREIAIMEMKTGLTPKGSPCKVSSTSTEISMPENTIKEVKQESSFIVTKAEIIILPKNELHLHDETIITESKTDQSKTKSKAQQSKSDKMLARDDKISTSPDVKFKLPKREDIEIPGMEAIEQSVQQRKIKVATEADTQDEAVKDGTDTDVTEKSNIKAVREGHESKSKKAKVSMPSFGIMKPDIRFPEIGIELPKKTTSSKSDEIKEVKREENMPLDVTKQKYLSLQEHEAIKPKIDNTESDEMLCHEVSIAIIKKASTQDNAEMKIAAHDPSLDKAEIKSKDMDTSPHKMKLPKLIMPKIGMKSIKGTSEAIIKEDITKQEDNIIEVVLDSEKGTSKADNKGKSSETDKTWSKLKMPSLDVSLPSLDVSLPKVKLPKMEGKSKMEDTKPETDASIELSKDQVSRDMQIEAVDDAPEGTGLRLAKFGISSPKQKKEGSGLVKGDGKIEVESQAEIKEPESKMKKRKISFPKFGFSKAEIKVSDADITLPTVEGSLQEEGAEVTEKYVESKTTEVEAEFQDSTDSPTKFRLPAIKLPKFGISFTKATDDREDIQIPDVSTEETTIDFKLPKGSGELTALPDIKGPEIILIVSKPEAELSLPEKKEETTGISIPKEDVVYSEQEKEMKLSPEMLFSKPEVSLTGHEINRKVGVVELSKPDIKAFEVDVSVPQSDFSMPEGKMDESVSLSKDEAEQKDLTIKFKLPSINLPKFGVKTSKVAKDLPMVDIDAEEPDVRLPEAQISMKLKDDAPLDDIKESTEGIHLTTEANYEGHSVDMKIEDVKPKEQGPTFNLAKFGISFSGVKDPDIDNSKLTIEGDTTLEAAKNKVHVSYQGDKPEDDSKGLDLKIKTPSFSLPKFGFSKADFSLPKTDASKPAEIKDYEEPIKETKEPSAESEQAEKVLEGSPTKFKLPKIKFPKIGVSLPKTTAADHDNQIPGITKEIKLPEAELSGDVLSVPKMDTDITLSLSKPDVDVSIKETEKIDNAPYEIMALSPEVKVGLADHGPGEKPAIGDLTDGINVQAQIIDTEVKFPSFTEDADIPEDPEKESETKLKKLKISFPKFGFSKSETKVPDVNTSVQKEPTSLPETEIKDIEVTFPDPELEVQLKTKSTTGSPSKFKLPTISLPKFNISSSRMVEESNAKADYVEKSKTEATSAAVSVSKDTETQYTEPSKVQFEILPGDAEIKTKEMDPESHASRFKMTKFEISFPKLKRPESKKGALKTVDSVEKPEGTLIDDMEMESHSVDGKVDVPEDTGVRMKKPKVQSSGYALSKHDIKAPEFSVKSDGVPMTTEEVDVNQPEHEIKTKTTGGSPLKFKLPTLKLPKFGISSSKVKPEVTDLGGEAQPLESEVLTSVEMSDGKIDLTVPNQDLGFEQPNVDTADISILEMKPGKPGFEDGVPDSKTMKTKKAGFSLPKLGFSKPDIKVPEIYVSLEQADTSKPEGGVEMKDQIINITVSKDQVEPKDLTIGSDTTKFKLPTINIPRIGGKAAKEEKDMSDVDIAVKGPDASCPYTQINVSVEAPSVDIREPHLVTEGQTVTADLNVEDTELEGGKIKMPKFGIVLPKIKGLDLGTSKTGDIAEGNIKVQETPEVDVSVQKPDISISEGGVNGTETKVDIKGSKVESDQKGSTIFGSPTKFKLPSISFPKFGVKSQKAALDIKVNSEIEETNTKWESSQPEVTLEVHPSHIEIQDDNTKTIADMPAADSKGLEVKVKRPSFSFPKLGFSKPNIPTPELDASVQKIDASIPESTVDLPDHTAEMTLPEVGKEAEQKDLTIAGSPTKFKLPTVNLPNFGLKTSKGTVNLSSEMSVPEPEIKVSAQIPTIDTDIRAKEIDVSATINETNIHLAEGRIIPPSIDADIQDISIKGKADIHVVDSKDLDVKVKKSSFSLPKLGFSKPDIKGQETDVSQLKTEMSMVEGNITVEDQGADITFPGALNEQDAIDVSQTKFKMPLISFPKIGMKYPKAGADIPTADLDIKEPEISFPETGEIEIKTSMVIKGSSAKVDIKTKETDIDGLGGKFKLPKFGIGMQKVKETEMEGKEKEVQQPICEIKDVTFEKKVDRVEMDSKGLKINLPKIGSKQELKAPEVDVSLPKVDTGISMEIADVSHQSADITSPTRFKLPTIHFPKFGIKASKGKVDSPTTNVDIKEAEVSLPDENINKSAEAPSVDIKGPTVNAEDISIEVNIKGKDVDEEQHEGKFKFPKFGITLPKIKGPDSEIMTEAKTGDSEKDIKSPEVETDTTSAKFGSPTKFKLPTIKLPKFGISIPKVTASTPKADADILDTKVSSVDIEVETPKMDPLDDIKVKTAVIETKSVETNVEAKGTQEGQENKFKLPKFEVKTGAPETGIIEPEIKIPAEDVSVPRVDTALPEGSVSIQKPEETELKDEKATSGSPSKFKFPSFKMPRFGISAHKSSDIKAEVTEVDSPDIKTDLNVEDKPIHVSKDTHIEGEIKETTEQAPEAVVKKTDGNKGSPSKFKLPSIKMPKINISRTKSQDEDDATIKASAPEMKEEDEKIKVDDLQGPDKSPKFTMPAIGDVFKGFEVEFNVPTLEEMEAKKDKPSGKKESESGDKAEESPEHKNREAQDKSRFKFKFPKLGFSQSSDESDKLADARFEESEKHIEPPADQKEEGDKEHTKTEKGGWFKFPKFSSPTKTTKITEKEIIQPSEAVKKSQINDDVEKESNKEPEKSPMSEIVEENISPTLSLRSSEAFADISSTLTTEQIAPSQTFPTKVKVKYGESTATVGVKDTKVQSDVVTSTARCELISMEPHQPEKVNIPFSSDASSPSVDTFKQMSGEIHVITSNIQAISETHQASILTNLEARGIHTSPLEVTQRSDSVLTVEETRVQSATHTLVERHVVKETLGDGKETILVTHTTRVLEGDAAEPISDETASSIRRLRDTVHTEKMRFFDSIATTEEVRVTSSEISIRHMDSSTDENGGK
ncbi:neuroblast differentiation-associated protein AHNAK-like [Triplophysa rosa]|uniref:Neuroblast differentiation-associated protein AHNAK-like n=1 Tax=Triplophysa rosa TaxID=992332 RepID=A0A9W7WPM4_TRIRA|nr:neuroblast differentiation-associated protein AHNAK-like [Triplophysa rosa]KAI7806013.1 putative neuroblast differentiation-associated protein AHNAK-like [Triplophysa rosa]